MMVFGPPTPAQRASGAAGSSFGSVPVAVESLGEVLPESSIEALQVSFERRGKA